ncbi:MAG: AMP-binding protein [Myxococcales bacterium]|nr:AMP-binding protein [Myxococcales bacterium]
MDELERLLPGGTRRGMAVSLWARERGGHEAVRTDRGVRSFAGLNANANRVLRGLRADGVAPGETVVVVASAAPEFVEVILACRRGGLQCVPLDTRASVETAVQVITSTHARAVFLDMRRDVFAANLLQQLDALGACELRVGFGPELSGAVPYANHIAPHDGDDVHQPKLGALLCHRLTETGRPIAVCRPGAQLPAASAATRAAGYRAGDDAQRHLCAVSLQDLHTLMLSVLGPLEMGSGIVLWEGFEPTRALETIERMAITHLHLEPGQIGALLELATSLRGARDMSSLTHLFHRSLGMPQHAKHAAIEWLGSILWGYYAFPECDGLLIGSADWHGRPGSVGRLGVHAHVRDFDDQVLAPGQQGELMLELESDFSYLDNPERTAMSGSGFHTGHLGAIDDQGFVQLEAPMGRQGWDVDGLVKAAVGPNMDNTLLQHPEVMEVVTCTVALGDYDEIPVAIVVLQRDDAFEEPPLRELDPTHPERARIESEFRLLCRRVSLAVSPAHYHFVACMPRTSTQMILTRRVHEWARSRYGGNGCAKRTEFPTHLEPTPE